MEGLEQHEALGLREARESARLVRVRVRDRVRVRVRVSYRLHRRQRGAAAQAYWLYLLWLTYLLWLYLLWQRGATAQARVDGHVAILTSYTYYSGHSCCSLWRHHAGTSALGTPRR